MKLRTNVVLILFLLAACTPAATATPIPTDLPPDTAVTSLPEGTNSVSQPETNPYATKPEDERLTRGEVFVEESGLLIRESFPPQVSVGFSGNLPTPCHDLRATIQRPDTENKIVLDVYTVYDPDMICTQVLKPFQATIPLEVFPTGHYTVWMNDQMVGEYDT